MILLNCFAGFHFVFVGFGSWFVSFIRLVFRNGFFLAKCNSTRAVSAEIGEIQWTLSTFYDEIGIKK